VWMPTKPVPPVMAMRATAVLLVGRQRVRDGGVLSATLAVTQPARSQPRDAAQTFDSSQSDGYGSCRDVDGQNRLIRAALAEPPPSARRP
jgi:hypothetical protein